MLFNARDFWLYESFDGHPVRLVKAQLGARGSCAKAREEACEEAGGRCDEGCVTTHASELTARRDRCHADLATERRGRPSRDRGLLAAARTATPARGGAAPVGKP